MEGEFAGGYELIGEIQALRMMRNVMTKVVETIERCEPELLEDPVIVRWKCTLADNP